MVNVASSVRHESKLLRKRMDGGCERKTPLNRHGRVDNLVPEPAGWEQHKQATKAFTAQRPISWLHTYLPMYGPFSPPFVRAFTILSSLSRHCTLVRTQATASPLNSPSRRSLLIACPKCLSPRSTGRGFSILGRAPAGAG